ncbi:YbhB/YbcL family Raf kinase inhibitor-like protein [Novosphingobium tardum]|jgi:Raf kinase inhibitor-like YbhB/YbcL family protein|uniref:YbhB/YbcL family Raf kinase inhibitor-like protein n=1 Tax=Novosphingobium tardum TaxID=1538021 RepID=A0ABV8RS42_9SPHN
MLEHVPGWLGRALRGARAGHAKLAVARLGDEDLLGAGGFSLTSPAFADGEELDPMFTADEEDACAPPLAWTDPPAGTEGLVLLVEDPDAPGAEPFVHLLGWGMEPEAGEILEGEDPPVVGRNSLELDAWLAPDPPAGHGPHDYVFQLFALDIPMELAPGSDRDAILDEMEGQILAVAVLTGTYSREG